jgi:CheY-like chemotaxis protein
MRVVVAEDVMLTREGITRLLTDAGVEVVGEAGDAAALLRAVRATRPDAAIVDIRMPPTHTDEGLVAAQQIRAEHPGTGVLILSQYIEPHYAMRLIDEHPERTGYLLKERVFDVANLTDAHSAARSGALGRNQGRAPGSPGFLGRGLRSARLGQSSCLRPRRVQMDHSVMLVAAGAVVRAAVMLLARSPDPGSLGLGS